MTLLAGFLSKSENLEVAQILLAGPGGGLGQLDEFFKQRLNLTIQVDPVALYIERTKRKLPRPGLGLSSA